MINHAKKEISAVIKKKVKLIPMEVLASKPNHSAPYKKVTSLLPIPPIVKGITDTMEEIRNMNKYSIASRETDMAFNIKTTLTNWANCTKAENPTDFQNTGRVVVKKRLFTNQKQSRSRGWQGWSTHKSCLKNHYWITKQVHRHKQKATTYHLNGPTVNWISLSWSQFDIFFGWRSLCTHHRQYLLAKKVVEHPQKVKLQIAQLCNSSPNLMKIKVQPKSW